jgi:hypothetical protein
LTLREFSFSRSDAEVEERLKEREEKLIASLVT